MAKKSNNGKGYVSVWFGVGVVAGVLITKVVRVGKRPLVDLILDRTSGPDTQTSLPTSILRGVNSAIHGVFDRWGGLGWGGDAGDGGPDPDGGVAGADETDLGVLPITG